MMLLAIELGSLNPEPYIPIIIQTLRNVNSHLYIVIFLTRKLLPKLDSPAKRAGRSQHLQELISAFYVCTASRMEISCDIVFADWCGYSLAGETWEYTTLNIPERNPVILLMLIAARAVRYTCPVTKVDYVSTDSGLSQRLS